MKVTVINVFNSEGDELRRKILEVYARAICRIESNYDVYYTYKINEKAFSETPPTDFTQLKTITFEINKK